MGHKPIEVLMDGQRLPAKAGEQVHSLFKRYPPNAGKLLAAKINQNLVSLDAVLHANCRLTPVFYTDREGLAVYRRTACLILYEAVEELYPEARIIVGQSLANGYYFDFVSDKPIDQEILNNIETRMRQIVSEGRPL